MRRRSIYVCGRVALSISPRARARARAQSRRAAAAAAAAAASFDACDISSYLFILYTYIIWQKRYRYKCVISLLRQYAFTQHNCACGCARPSPLAITNPGTATANNQSKHGNSSIRDESDEHSHGMADGHGMAYGQHSHGMADGGRPPHVCGAAFAPHSSCA